MPSDESQKRFTFHRCLRFEVIGDKGLWMRDFEVIEKGTVLMKFMKHPCDRLCMTQQIMTRESKCSQDRKRLLYVHGGSVSIGNCICSTIPILKNI